MKLVGRGHQRFLSRSCCAAVTCVRARAHPRASAGVAALTCACFPIPSCCCAVVAGAGAAGGAAVDAHPVRVPVVLHRRAGAGDCDEPQGAPRGRGCLLSAATSSGSLQPVSYFIMSCARDCNKPHGASWGRGQQQQFSSLPACCDRRRYPPTSWRRRLRQTPR